MFLPPLLLLLLPTAQGETVVTAPRSTQPATSTSAGTIVLTDEDLRRTGERSLPRAISKAAGYAGVWVQETNLGGGAPFIRGLAGNQILIVIDGVRLNDSTTRFGPNQSLNTIDPAIVERVEVLRGPASVLYGSDAIGGAILIWTKRRDPSSDPEQQGYRGLFDLSYVSAAKGGRGALGVSHADDRVGWLGIGGGQVWGDLRAGNAETQDETGYHGSDFFGSAVYRVDDQRNLRVTASLHRSLDVPRTDRVTVGFGQVVPAFSIFRFAEQRRERWMAAYTDETSRGFADRFQVRASFRRYDERRERQSTGSTTFRVEQDRVQTFGLNLGLSKALGEDHLLTYGFDFDHDTVDSSRTDTDLVTGVGTPRDGAFAPASRFTGLGVFVQDEISSFEPFDVTAGVRYSWFDFSFDEFTTGVREDGSFGAVTGSLAVSRRIAEGWRVAGTLSQGFRAPNLADLAKDDTFGGGDEIHNPNLDPERSLSAELALELSKERVQGSVAVFATEIDDVIGRTLTDVGDPGVIGDETYLRENQGEVELYGIEAGTRVQVAKDSPFFGEASISYVRGQQFDDDIPSLNDVPWRRVPPLHGRFALVWDPNGAGDTQERSLDRISLEVPWADDQDRLHPGDLSDPRIGEPTRGWAIWNLDVEGPLGEGGPSRWFAGVHNILDKNYRIHGSGFDAPGRSLILGLRLSF